MFKQVLVPLVVGAIMWAVPTPKNWDAWTRAYLIIALFFLALFLVRLVDGVGPTAPAANQTPTPAPATPTATAPEASSQPAEAVAEPTQPIQATRIEQQSKGANSPNIVGSGNTVTVPKDPK